MEKELFCTVFLENLIYSFFRSSVLLFFFSSFPCFVLKNSSNDNNNIHFCSSIRSFRSVSTACTRHPNRATMSCTQYSSSVVFLRLRCVFWPRHHFWFCNKFTVGAIWIVANKNSQQCVRIIVPPLLEQRELWLLGLPWRVQIEASTFYSCSLSKLILHPPLGNYYSPTRCPSNTGRRCCWFRTGSFCFLVVVGFFLSS